MSTQAPPSGGKFDPDDVVRWNRTVLVRERFSDSPYYRPPVEGDTAAPHGRYGKRPIIGRDMPKIIGGVYPGQHEREVIVVDDTGKSDGDVLLKRFYDELFLPPLRRALSSLSGPREPAILKYIYEAVQKYLPYDGGEVDAFVEKLSEGEADRKIHLASFLSNGAGICRHQGLLAGYLIEKMNAEMDPSLHLDGALSVERSSITYIGGHAWTRYTASSGEVWIIDAAHGKFGRLTDIRGGWGYARPGEKVAKEPANTIIDPAPSAPVARTITDPEAVAHEEVGVVRRWLRRIF